MLYGHVEVCTFLLGGQGCKCLSTLYLVHYPRSYLQRADLKDNIMSLSRPGAGLLTACYKTAAPQTH